MKIIKNSNRKFNTKKFRYIKRFKKTEKTRTTLKLSDFLYLYCSSNKSY